ncbi:MAG: dTMP kinase [Anaerolineaceae bacterium]|nr:MAG: dTMP kinase [Anaerolineaceae bacterium]
MKSDNKYTSKFIVLEGIDSAVLAEQAALLDDWLRSVDLTVVVTREPTDGPIGGQIRLGLSKRLELDDFTRAVLFLSDRLDHLNRPAGILEDLSNGKYVICIRYILSAYAYQNRALSLEWLHKINRQCRWPDLVVFIDTPAGISLKRRVKQEVYNPDLWNQQILMLERQRDDYVKAIEYCQQNGKLVSVVDGNQPPPTIHQICQGLVTRLGVEQ